MQMEIQREDSVFGLLTFNPASFESGTWTKQEHLSLMGGPIPLTIQIGNEGPAQEQRQAYLMLNKAEANLKAELQEALFEFYKSEREIYADIYEDICDDPSQAEEFVPVLSNPEEIWGILDPLQWMILGPESWVGQQDVSGIQCDTVLSWHGCWDIEHEFIALVKGGKLIGIRGPGNF